MLTAATIATGSHLYHLTPVAAPNDCDQHHNRSNQPPPLVLFFAQQQLTLSMRHFNQHARARKKYESIQAILRLPKPSSRCKPCLLLPQQLTLITDDVAAVGADVVAVSIIATVCNC